MIPNVHRIFPPLYSEPGHRLFGCHCVQNADSLVQKLNPSQRFCNAPTYAAPIPSGTVKYNAPSLSKTNDILALQENDKISWNPWNEKTGSAYRYYGDSLLSFIFTKGLANADAFVQFSNGELLEMGFEKGKLCPKASFVLNDGTRLNGRIQGHIEEMEFRTKNGIVVNFIDCKRISDLNEDISDCSSEDESYAENQTTEGQNLHI